MGEKYCQTFPKCVTTAPRQHLCDAGFLGVFVFPFMQGIPLDSGKSPHGWIVRQVPRVRTIVLEWVNSTNPLVLSGGVVLPFYKNNYESNLGCSADGWKGHGLDVLSGYLGI